MALQPDLDAAISLHPHPIHIYPHRSETATPEGESSASRDAKSTGVQAMQLPDDEPISRYPTLHSQSGDLEGQRPPVYTQESDPYHLSAKMKSPSEIDLIRANSSRKRDGCGPIIINRKARQAKKIQGFYESQNENIERLLKPVEEHRREAKAGRDDTHLRYKIAVNASFAANLMLAGLQVYGAVSSGSLSLFTTMADALFDPLSNVTLILSNRAVNKVDTRRFPSGKARIETAGNIVFCFLMTAVSMILIAMSAKELADGSDTAKSPFHLASVIAVAIAFVTKLALFCYCWALRDIYSQVRILWEDHRNDLFINGVGILTSVGGSKLRWWIDPMGAIILSCLIITLWLRTAYAEFQLLIGVSADTQTQQLITYISMTHSPRISAIDTVRAYHSGPRMIVEVDIVMSPDESLRDTHDIAEELQIKLESLPLVERAYVHVDYETSHKPEHFWKKEL